MGYVNIGFVVIPLLYSVRRSRRSAAVMVVQNHIFALLKQNRYKITCGCGGTAYTADLKSAGESLRVQISPAVPMIILWTHRRTLTIK